MPQSGQWHQQDGVPILDEPAETQGVQGMIGHTGRALSRRFCRITNVGILLALVSPAYAADSIVIGRALSNSYARALSDSYEAAKPCPEDYICMDVIFRWVIDPERIVAGPALKGRIKALTFQHTGVNDRYLKSLRLFVFRPIGDIEIPHSPDDGYYLVSSSPVYDDGTYCISVDPSASGLQLKNVTKRNDGNFCFGHHVLQ